ncbi:SDR family NAD(P)-dependent oxidoreductase [Teredinibacter sp. KSP-S5-2]|uniref:SDR family NAD(P)-dependent oxidoreductase n=1 Tax=Teredinibacter sp. KSP-S5-2 TaxID=3034506 RepID=UPI00293510BC|nr:SDR family NAD(P)-dependent oxidoreductase [Teredinibacter sp. KSP-S5-2]WNO11559.1 SDR family NAD(P)-dependent oxidoreductase [Teredinibacter sp. KSP-S5-2]
MIDFAEYVVSELKSKRLSKKNALSLIKQFYLNADGVSKESIIHPLLHTNTSDLTQQSYATLFNGNEFFLNDHQIHGKKVLPGVAYLEMVRAAIQQALADEGVDSTIEIRNVVWAQPVVVDAKQTVQIALFINDEVDEFVVDYEIFTALDGENGEEIEIVHSQGQVVLSEKTQTNTVNLADLQGKMQSGRFSFDDIYQAYDTLGIRYGDSHKGVQEIFKGNNEVLARLKLDRSVITTLQDYVLHPALLDSAVQTPIGLLDDIKKLPEHPSLPFALNAVKVLSPCTEEMYVWTRYSNGSKPGDSITKLDIDLYDQHGQLCVQLIGFSSRSTGSEIHVPTTAKKHATNMVFASPGWREAELISKQKGSVEQKHLVLAGFPSQLVDTIEKEGCFTSFTNLSPSGEIVSLQQYENAALTVFEKIKTLLKSKPKNKVLLQLVISDEQGVLQGLNALLKTAAIENPQFSHQIIQFDSCSSAQEIISILDKEQASDNSLVRYQSGARSTRCWDILPNPTNEPSIPFKSQGVYVITGGLGGLGLLFAKEIFDQVPDAKVILTGRSVLSAEKRALLEAHFSDSSTYQYQQLNIENGDETKSVFDKLLKQHGNIHGVIHSAGMLKDEFILKKNSVEFGQVLSPKVSGTIHLDEACKDLALDFFVMFSSVSGWFGNQGQADYACANGFLDQFAQYRNVLVEQGQRQGKTVSINWPLWQWGGMNVDAEVQNVIENMTGMQPMDQANGIRAFYTALQQPAPQFLAMQGDSEKLVATICAEADEETAPDSEVIPVEKPVTSADTTNLSKQDIKQKTEDFLRAEFSTVLKIPEGKIQVKAPLEKYGIDSILAMNVTSQLEKTFGSLPKTLFFEYQTIADLTEYFLEQHIQLLRTRFSAKAPVEQSESKPVAKVKPTQVDHKLSAVDIRKTRKNKARFTQKAVSERNVSGKGGYYHDEPIAIVGLSGRYPESPTIEQYWQNLKEGKDCITEVPASRWDWKEFYSDNRHEDGRHYSRWGGFIEGVDEFDPRFFNMSPREAELVDPQERLFLQHVWMAIEDAGLTRENLRIPHKNDLAGQVGVYAGVMYSEYQLFGAEAIAKGKNIGVGGSYASVANRVSYLLNLHGPSMTLDTMCSSSLTAIHIACEDLKHGRTDCAIAGGVNVSIHPSKYFMLSSGQFISSDGHCQSFGEGGDGYIPGEGVGVVILKTLSQAKKDGHHIYGLIKGSAINHGGKTNGYSVPNPQAQSSVITRALNAAKVDPRHISYIEAHGTGTKLGDPIEISALTKAFYAKASAEQVDKETGYCLVGSAKSNIGHCESAAGIAGLTKVLLQMENKQIVPSLHSQVLNPHIDFSTTPFVVNQQLTTWKQPEIDGKHIPRIAGISSFGAGGSNAHLIIEEYVDEPEATNTQPLFNAGEALAIVLSARTEQQLHSKAKELLSYIQAQGENLDLLSLAYTLQLGREEMDERLAFSIDSVANLVEKLEGYLTGVSNIENCFYGRVAADEDEIIALVNDEEMREALEKWIAKRKFSKLLAYWVKGLPLEWGQFYAVTPKRARLPVYPFAKERYWIDSVIGDLPGVAHSLATGIHPLLHKNTSDLTRLTYQSQFSGTEFFLADHQVALPNNNGTHKILPGVAYLEIARAAVEQAASAIDYSAIEIHNVVWQAPIVVDGNKQITTELFVEGDDQIAFDVFSDENNNEVLHSQGWITLSKDVSTRHIDIHTLLTSNTFTEVSTEDLYRAYEGMGIYYGKGFQGVHKLYRNDQQVIAELKLPASVSSNAEDFSLHPSVLDSAVHASLGLLGDLKQLNSKPMLPFALDKVRVLSPCSANMFVSVSYAQNAGANSDIVKLDIDLLDRDGNLCVEMRGLTSRQLDSSVVESATTYHEILFATPEWQASPISHSATQNKQTRCVMYIGQTETNAKTLSEMLTRGLGDAENVYVFTGLSYSETAVQIFEQIKTLLANKNLPETLVQIVSERPDMLGISGLLKTAAMENPKITGQFLLLDPGTTDSALTALINENSQAVTDSVVKYQHGIRLVQRWCEQAFIDEAEYNAYREQGVYIITGGLGSLGMEFTRDILNQTTDAQVIVTGRSELSEEKKSQIELLATNPERVSYQSLDLSDYDAVCHFFNHTLEQFGQVNGIIHSAGMIADNFILKKNRAEFMQVLEPKVTCTQHLDQASQQCDLDFFVLFSSVSSVLGNPGQADYASANGFMDQFAHMRNSQVDAGQRSGKTLSINWPIWQSGGMEIDDAGLDVLKRVAGVVPMQSQNGLRAFHRSLQLAHSQSIVMEGELEKLQQTLHGIITTPAPIKVAPIAELTLSDNTVEKSENYLKQLFSATLKLSADEVDSKQALDKYGMDSVIAMRLTNDLETVFGSLSKTLFFEYQTISELAAYLVSLYPDIVRSKIGNTDTPIVATASAQPSSLPVTSHRTRPGRNRFSSPNKQQQQDVAIIGVSGRYPQANTIEEFWQNLVEGKDCISEIPEGRWDHARFFDENRNQEGKTYSKWGGFLTDIDKFDPLFFSISPKEAELIDPQERLFLETVWHAIEDAGYSKDAISQHKVGVYVGVMWGQYELYGSDALLNRDSSVPSSSYASIANRISYYFDFDGPSIALDTMCSSSLTALHLACDAIRNQDIQVAVAGGVNLAVHPQKYVNLSQGNFLASDGRCRSFGEGGDGYVPGEGVGALLLKSLDKAIADGDHIYGTIKATAINHGGKTNGYTVPNPNAQGNVIADALTKANIQADTLSYIETHGTGTSLGDPIEITGLKKALGESADKKQIIPIGSVKSNIGHLESAAGMAAVTKVLLQLKHNQLVPSLHAKTLNPNIDFENSPFYVQTELADWHAKNGNPRRVGVSSFGAGGANAHVIIEEYIAPQTAAAGSGVTEAFVLSARDAFSLNAYVKNIVDYLRTEHSATFSDIAYTSQVGRTPLKERLAVIANSVDELASKLSSWLNGQVESGVYSGTMDEKSGANALNLIQGEAGKAFINVVMENNELDKVAKLWVAGVDIQWPQLKRSVPAKRISLPTYPFAKERYWISPVEQSRIPAAAINNSRKVLQPLKRAVTQSSEQHARVIYTTEWQPSAITSRDDATFNASNIITLNAEAPFVDELTSTAGRQSLSCLGNETVLNNADIDRTVERIQSYIDKPIALVYFPAKGKNALTEFQSFIRLCKGLLGCKNADRVKLLTVSLAQDGHSDPQFASFASVVKTVQMENPKYTGKLVEIIAGDIASDVLVNLVIDELQEATWQYQEVRYLTPESRYVKKLTRLNERKAGYLPIKQGGVYLISGGLGGLGYRFAQYLAQSFHARLVLFGRSKAEDIAHDKLSSLEALGGKVLYQQADVALQADVEKLVVLAKEKFGSINGVIHSAGVNRDSFILNKTNEEIASVLLPKIDGVVNLDSATATEALDIFICFSSVAGYMGNLGQSDYAYANHYLDSFIEQRDLQCRAGKRSGQSLSINWPYWQDGGMSLSSADLDIMQQQTGMQPMTANEGIPSLEILLSSNATQGIPLYGLPSKIQQYFEGSTSIQNRPANTVSKHVAPVELKAKTAQYLKTLISKEIKLPVERIDSNERFESLGFDSVIISRINAALENDIADLPKTIFYEYETLDELVSFLVIHHGDDLATRLGVEQQVDNNDTDTVVDETFTETDCRGLMNEDDDIAIIGQHGIYPQSGSMQEYWQNLLAGKDLIDVVPSGRWDSDAFYHRDPAEAANGKIYCKWGGFLEDHDKFDAGFFNISARDAKVIDPQERLFLQSVWSAFEDAGYTREQLKQKHPKGKSANVGVFVGVTTNSYNLLGVEEKAYGNTVNPASLPWSIANRISYFFDFQGPSIPVDTACSSALVAIDLAIQSIRNGDCQIAVAGGVNLYLHPNKYQSFCQKGMLSQDGKTYSYGAGQDGFVPSEGVGALILKPLSAAIKDNDPICAVIKGSAYAHSGKSNGYSAPNPNSQASLIDAVLQKANVHPETIGYIEGHGTGTQLGDSLEVAALSNAFGKYTDKKQFCPIGSVKANIGHPEAAAGTAGIAKIIQQFTHQHYVPSINVDEVNPNIDFAKSPFFLVNKATPWTTDHDEPRRAMINAFGSGGVNACVLLEEYNLPSVSEYRADLYAVPLSARNDERLLDVVRRLHDFLENAPHADIANIAYTLQTGRETMQERIVLLAKDNDELKQLLGAFIEEHQSEKIIRTAGESITEGAIDSAFTTNDLHTLAQAWVGGIKIDWLKLYGDHHPCRISLPSYPFAKERHWVTTATPTERKPVTQVESVNKLHPLISYNSSTLNEICFTSCLSADAYYARDHQINGQKMLPGAAFLELACVAGTIAGRNKVTRIDNVVWMQPVLFNHTAEKDVQVSLKKIGDQVEYVVHSFDDTFDKVLHAEGALSFAPHTATKAQVDLTTLINNCDRQISGGDYYPNFKQAGFDYGTCFQTLDTLYTNKDYALSLLVVAEQLKQEFSQYILHPCLLDGAFQTVSGLISGIDPSTPYLPFAIEEIHLFHPLALKTYVHVEEDSVSGNSDIKKFNILLLNEQGRVAVEIRRFCVRALKPASGNQAMKAELAE